MTMRTYQDLLDLALSVEPWQPDEDEQQEINAQEARKRRRRAPSRETRVSQEQAAQGDFSHGAGAFGNRMDEQPLSADGGDEPPPEDLAPLIDKTHARFAGYPAVCNGVLFVPASNKMVHWLDSPDRVMTWLRSICHVEWTKGPTAVTERQYYEGLRMFPARSYSSIELVPHEPPLQDVYYTHPDIEPGDGHHLSKLLDFTSPSTGVDRQLLRAMIATLFWGGECGRRPAFLVTVPDQYGSGGGKSELVKLIAKLVHPTDAILDAEKTTDPDLLRKRLLNGNVDNTRIILLDNTRGTLNWEEFERLVTAESISGHKLYHGEGKARNHFVWIVTTNDPRLGGDAAKRVIPVHLQFARYSKTWEADAHSFVREHRDEIIADIIGFLRQPSGELDEVGRFASWEHAIISRLDDPNEVQRIVRARQREADVDMTFGEKIEAFFEAKLRQAGYDVAHSRVWIASGRARIWLSEFTEKEQTKTSTSRRLNHLIKKQAIKKLRYSKTSETRGFVWELEPTNASIFEDLEERIIHLEGKKMADEKSNGDAFLF